MSEVRDIYIHSGDIYSVSEDVLLGLAKKPRSSGAYFLVCTYGGLARSAYRMIRGLRHAYEHVALVVAGPCKSAGTLLAIGADELVMTGSAELGPLDVQILKDGEPVGTPSAARQSGLAPSVAFQTLGAEALSLFTKAYKEMKVKDRLPSAVAAETAARLVMGLFAPIYGQIDPLRVGEWAMAHGVAYQYAGALTTHEGAPRANIKTAGIFRLLSAYPSHDYVIDRQEARELFTVVRNPTDAERRMLAELQKHVTPHGALSTPADRATTIRLPGEDFSHAPPPRTSGPKPPAEADPPGGAGGAVRRGEGAGVSAPGARKARSGDRNAGTRGGKHVPAIEQPPRDKT